MAKGAPAVRVVARADKEADIAKAAARWAAETEVKWAVVAQAAECNIETRLRPGFFLCDKIDKIIHVRFYRLTPV